MKERVIADRKELFSVLTEYSDKGFYFRGEIKDYKETACLPAYLRDMGKSCNSTAVANEMLKRKLEELGVGFPYSPPVDDSISSIINHVLTSDYGWSFLIWGEEKLEALMAHYSPDFKALDKITKDMCYDNSLFFTSEYLDITSDIMMALHFACSEYCFLSQGKEQKPVKPEEVKDSFLFVFDLKDIENKEFLKLVSYPSYSYFCKEEPQGTLCFQSFDRITHQHGSFLAPKKNENKEIYYDKFKEELKSCLHEKITIKSNLKSELYEIFGKEEGMNYYFPKIPCAFPKEGNKIQQAYKNMEGTTLLK
ncbi:MAG: hypothetical protein LBB47_06025 [Spirochaetaceae bacterium]|jgi:hypothetical protein|nr:hypothetical protein [Spirochaetaceae bacterium]